MSKEFPVLRYVFVSVGILFLCYIALHLYLNHIKNVLQEGGATFLSTDTDYVYIVKDSDEEILSGLQAMKYYRIPEKGLIYQGSQSTPDGSRITERSVRLISELEWLEDLDLDNTGISDQSLRHLSRLKNLRSLGLMNTAISDDGLKHLVHLRKLEWLLIGDTDVTSSGLEWLIRQVPTLDNSMMQDQVENMKQIELKWPRNARVDD